MKDHTGSLMDKRQLLECGLQSSTNIVPARAGEKKQTEKKGKGKMGGKEEKEEKNGKQRGRKGTKKNKSAEAADSRPEM